MKKKWPAIALAIGMVFSITACGGKGGGQELAMRQNLIMQI